jgi:hypothetical protein
LSLASSAWPCCTRVSRALAMAPEELPSNLVYLVRGERGVGVRLQVGEDLLQQAAGPRRSGLLAARGAPERPAGLGGLVADLVHSCLRRPHSGLAAACRVCCCGGGGLDLLDVPDDLRDQGRVRSRLRLRLCQSAGLRVPGFGHAVVRAGGCCLVCVTLTAGRACQAARLPHPGLRLQTHRRHPGHRLPARHCCRLRQDRRSGPGAGPCRAARCCRRGLSCWLSRRHRPGLRRQLTRRPGRW